MREEKESNGRENEGKLRVGRQLKHKEFGSGRREEKPAQWQEGMTRQDGRRRWVR